MLRASSIPKVDSGVPGAEFLIEEATYCTGHPELGNPV